MKKFLAFFISLATCFVCALGVAGCNSGNGRATYKVYAPDGAPALALTGIDDGEDSVFNVNVVAADTINAYISGDNPQADFAVMPVNAAVKLLGSGEKYRMLGTVTHGNLFLMGKQGVEEIAVSAALNKLVGKTVGVINLANVPGLTFKVILSDNGIEYNELKDGASVDGTKVNLRSITAQEALPTNTACDYFVVPEPAASTKKAATGGKLDFAGDLQTLYGGTDGYPQAVAVAKKSVIESDEKAVEQFISALEKAPQTLADSSAEEVVEKVSGWLKNDMQPTFTSANLNATVVAHCGIRFVNNANGKQAAVDFMQKLNAVSNGAWGNPLDAFFY